MSSTAERRAERVLDIDREAAGTDDPTLTQAQLREAARARVEHREQVDAERRAELADGAAEVEAILHARRADRNGVLDTTTDMGRRRAAVRARYTPGGAPVGGDAA